jgi:unsaturated chondroitin disaccharide hydrolase
MKTIDNILKENKGWIDPLFEKIENKFEIIAKRSVGVVTPRYDKATGRFKDASEASHIADGICDWTNGFYPGLNLLLYKETGKQIYLDVAKAAEKRMDEGIATFDYLNHDVGFMWHIMSGAIYRLTGDKSSRIRNLYTAATLASRFVIGGNYIVAWNHTERQNWTIIDTMMNLPQLYWASEEKNDDRFKRVAMAHADTALRTHIREDGSVNHIVIHDRETGDTVETLGGQGYGVGSSWSRGQAWAIYGFTLSYIHTGEKRYLDAAKRVANYFISACAVNEWLPLCDFRSPETPVIYDSSAGACACCGFIELAKILPENEGGLYLEAATKIIHAMAEKFINLDAEKDYILESGAGAYPDLNAKIQNNHFGPINYGDFYFVEALLKLRGSDFLIW